MYSRLPNIGTGAFIWQILPSRPIPNLPMPNLPKRQNLPNKGTGAYIRQARVSKKRKLLLFKDQMRPLASQSNSLLEALWLFPIFFLLPTSGGS